MSGGGDGLSGALLDTPKRARCVALHVLDDDTDLVAQVLAAIGGEDEGFFALSPGRDLADRGEIAVIVGASAGNRVVDRAAELRARAFPGPILVVSRAVDEALMVAGYQAGAHIWLVAPLRAAVFRAQLGALARRFLGPDEAEVEIRLQPDRASLVLDGQRIHLTPRGYELFTWLLVRREHWFTEEEILHALYSAGPNSSAVRVQVGKIRKALGERYAWLLRSSEGLGYCVTLRLDSTAARELSPHRRFGSGVRRRTDA